MMAQPAARVTDMHVCPMITPGVPPIPHIGGPLLAPGVPNVLISGLPAVTLGNMAICTGPLDIVTMGSMKVFIGGKPAARMGDSCAHGGTIITGSILHTLESGIHRRQRIAQLINETVTDSQRQENPAGIRIISNDFGQGLIKTGLPHKRTPPLTDRAMTDTAKMSLTKPQARFSGVFEG